MYLRDFFALKPFRDYSLCSVCILPQPAFYPQSAVCILHAVCILPLVRNLQSAVRSLHLTLTANFYIAGSNLKKNDPGIVIRSRHWLRAMLTNFSYSKSQSKWLGHFGVALSPQCWCTRFGDRTAINNFERDEVSTRREKTAFG